MDMISAEEFNIFSRDSQDRLFMVSAIDIQQIIAGKELPEWCSKFASVFLEKESQELPPHHEGVDLIIELEGGKSPLFRLIYYHSPQESAAIREYIQTILAKGWIRASKSSAGALLLYTAKKDGGIHIYIDFRGLNTISLKNRYPLPLIDETIS